MGAWLVDWINVSLAIPITYSKSAKLALTFNNYMLE